MGDILSRKTMLPQSEMWIEDSPFCVYIQISRSLEHLVIALFLVSRETLYNFPNATMMDILSADKYSGIKQLFVYSFRKKNKNDSRVCVQYVGVCATEMKITLLFAFSYIKSGRFGHRFGSKITLIGCTGSVWFLHLGRLSSNPVYFWWFTTFQVDVSSHEMWRCKNIYLSGL